MNSFEILGAIRFLDEMGVKLTDEQCKAIMDTCKENLSRDEIHELSMNIGGYFYTYLSEYEGEIGGFRK